MTRMQIVFMGTSKFAVPILKALIEKAEKREPYALHLIGVVTQPDRPGGRGNRLTPSAVKVAAEKHGLPLYQPQRARADEFICKLNELQPDVIVVADYGQILPRCILDIPPCGVINVHPSMLPKYRGAAPIHRAIISGETHTGITIMLLDEGEDTGDIILQKEVEILDSDTTDTLCNRLADISPGLLLEALAMVSPPSPPPTHPQDESKATYAPKLTKEEGMINWSKSAVQIRNLVRGTYPWPGAYTHLEKMLLKIITCEIVDPQIEDALPGTIYTTPKKELAVKTGEGTLILKTVQPANKRKMEAGDFINGYRVKTGDQFF